VLPASRLRVLLFYGGPAVACRMSHVVAVQVLAVFLSSLTCPSCDAAYCLLLLGPLIFFTKRVNAVYIGGGHEPDRPGGASSPLASARLVWPLSLSLAPPIRRYPWHKRA
jgi:hypothetical protein